MLRLLLLVVAGFIVWQLARYAVKALRGPETPPPGEPRFEPMARCPRCGAHVPRQQLDAQGECQRCRE